MKKKTVITYARLAAIKQAQGEPFLEQKMRMLAYCKENNLKVIGLYEDHASGNNFDRPQFQK